jgi:hypothetical protein
MLLPPVPPDWAENPEYLRSARLSSIVLGRDLTFSAADGK